MNTVNTSDTSNTLNKTIFKKIYDINVLNEKFLQSMYKNDYSIEIYQSSIKEIVDHLTSSHFTHHFEDGEFVIKGWDINWNIEFIGKDYNLLLSGNLWYKNYFELKVV